MDMAMYVAMAKYVIVDDVAKRESMCLSTPLYSRGTSRSILWEAIYTL